MKVIMRPTSHPGLLTSGNAHYGLIQMVVCSGKIFYILEVIYNFLFEESPFCYFTVIGRLTQDIWLCGL